ncbi:AAA family ATPase [Streptococcus pneumoniae]|uniref:AAA family ATPase n=1 Tax=Streptococcus pneumoniae TaxID=1313 RepID=UPI000B594868|nr:SMC family ATPase [Streptococcus pneumoniae]SNN34654.1 Purine NTPase [Streptococcus pneumoniae]SNO66552.1 Purine NTPase [Streptococcus pneumoniae]
MIRLKQVTIKNFRNFQGEYEFDFTKNITIFLGDNGNGKSSIFDAIQWCITGKIDRFGENSAESWRNILINKDSNDCSVEILFSNELKLKRSVSRNSNITVSCQDGDDRVVRGEGKVKDCLNSAFVNSQNNNFDFQEALKSSLLAQDQVLNFIASDTPTQRYNVLSSILGMEEIAKIKQNLETVRRIIEKKVNEEDRIEKQITEEIENQKLKLETKHDIANINIEIANEFNFEDKQNEKDNLLKSKTQIEDKLNRFHSLNTIDGDIGNLSRLTEKIQGLESFLKNSQSERERIIKDLALNENSLEQNKKNIERVNQEMEIISQNGEKGEELKKIEKQLSSPELYELSFELEESIQEQIYNFNRLLDKYNYTLSRIGEYNQLLQNRESVPKSIDKLRQKIKHKELEITNHQNNIIDLNSKLLSNNSDNDIELLIEMVREASKFVNSHREFENNCPVCNQSVLNVSVHFDRRIAYLLQQSKITAERIGKHKRQTRELEEQVNNKQKEIGQLQFTISDLENQYSEIQRRLQSLEGHSLYVKEYFSLDHSQIDLSINNLKYNIEKRQQYLALKNKKGQIAQQLEEQSDVRFSGLNLEQLLKENRALTKKNDELSTLKKELMLKIEEQKITLDSLKRMDELIGEISKEYRFADNDNPSIVLTDLINDKVKKIDRLSQELRNHKNIIEYNTIKDDLLNKEESLRHVQKVKEKLDNKYKLVDKEINHINQKFSFSKIINSNKSIIQKYFNYLNPNVATYRNLHLNIDDNKNTLDIEIVNSNQTIKAANVLSSGQLNVLAISIFIAKNIGQNNSAIDFIAIDDPIQNMDDINQFSMIDVLGRLNKQLIFTTHDAKYVNLFLKKNELRLNNISVYYLNAEEERYENILENN